MRVKWSYLGAVGTLSLFSFTWLVRQETTLTLDTAKSKAILTADPVDLLVAVHSIDKNSCTNNTIMPKGWCLDADRVPRYVDGGKPPSFIRHYNHKGYEKCLAGKTLVFIGDSRVRYQFMHLASYLVSKRFMRCQDLHSLNNKSGLLPDPECYLIDHENHQRMSGKDWNSWYQKSTAMLESCGDDNTQQQESLCDCYRPNPFQPQQTFENRFIKQATPNGEVNLVYLQNFENLIRIDADFPPFSSYFPSSSSKRCTVGECGPGNRNNEFQGNLTATLEEVLPLLNTTHAFVNLGWSHLFGLAAQSEFSCVIPEFERHHPDMKVNLISHVPNQGYKGKSTPYNFSYAKEMKCASGVIDRYGAAENVPTNWYWDNQHVLGILNEEYNHQLVEKICPLQN